MAANAPTGMTTFAKRTQREWLRALEKARERAANLDAWPSRTVMPWFPATLLQPLPF
jgi:hypothetical protein